MISELILYAAVLTLVVYCITKMFLIREYHEKRKESVFGWMHGNLIEEIYIPLAAYSKTIPLALRWKGKNEHQKDVLLFAVSGFLDGIFKNRKLAGGNEFFTQDKSSNECLRKLSDRTVAGITELSGESGDRCKAVLITFYTFYVFPLLF